MAVAGLVVGVVLARTGASHPRAAESPSASTPISTPVSATAGPGPAPSTSPPGSALSLGLSAAIAVAFAGSHLVVEQPGQLAIVDPVTGAPERYVPLRGLGPTDEGSAFAVQPEPGRDAVWLIGQEGTPYHLAEYDTSTWAPIRQVSVGWPIGQTAVLDGTLYLATDAGLAAIGPHATTAVLVPGAPAGVLALAADPTRHRLLFELPSGPASWVPGGPVTRRPGPQAVKGQLTVVDGHPWLLGYDPDGSAVLDQLDPVELFTVRTVTILDPATGTALLGPGAELAAAGQHVVWVRGAGGDGLWCVDAGSGAIAQSWADLPGPVASIAGHAVLALAGTPTTLTLHGCRG